MTRGTRAARSLLLLVLAGLGGCATVDFTWEPAANIRRPPASRYPKAPAVELLRNDWLGIAVPASGRRQIIWKRHRRIAILNEAGVDLAEVRVPIGSPLNSQLVLLKARTISPDGQVHELPASEIRDDETKSYGELLAQNSIEPGARRVTKVFRLPRVQVGSIIEYVAVVNHLGAPAFHLQRMSTALPVQVYEGQLMVSPTVEFAVTPVNLPPSIVFHRDEVDGYQRATIALGNLPGDVGEAFQPPPLLRSAWWSFRSLRYNFGSGVPLDIGVTWADALGSTSRLLTHNNQWLFLFDWPDIDRSKCGDVACQVTQALDVLRQRAELVGFADEMLDVRSVRWIAGSGTANSSEKATLLYRMLDKAGVTARFAATARYFGIYDESEPTPEVLDHLLLYLPAQRGLAHPVWVDPSCEYCRFGEVPPWLAGVDAFVIGADLAFNHLKFIADKRPITGEAAAPWQRRIEYQATLGESGDLTLAATERWDGGAAVARRMETRSWTAEQFAATAETFVKQRFPSGRLLDASPETCDRAQGHCQRTLRMTVAGYATRDGDQLIVPLTLLSSPWDDRFLDENRIEDLYVGEPALTAETASFSVPPGWSVADRPAVLKGKTPMLDAQFEVTSGAGAITVTRNVQTRVGRQSRDVYPGVRQVIRRCAGTRQASFTLRRLPAVSATR